MQLVLLCKESVFKKCTHERVFSRLIKDLKKLESEGLELNNGVYVKAILSCIAGDNLGSNCLGGFTENFATSRHFFAFVRFIELISMIVHIDVVMSVLLHLTMIVCRQ